MAFVKPKKHLGQHFLKEPIIAENLAKAITCHGGVGNVLEIGPGTGILTRALQARKFQNLKMVEIDLESIAYLREHQPELDNDVIPGDFLQMDLKALFNGEAFVLAGNFPYNISSQILFRIWENHEMIPEMVGMFQKEVAERIASGPGSKDYGILSVLLQCYYRVEYLFTVDEHCFNPPPKVKSGVIRLERNERQALPISDSFMKTVVKSAFGQRRKTLRNSLKSLTGDVIPEGMEEMFKLRPEQLGTEEFIGLAERLLPTKTSRDDK